MTEPSRTVQRNKKHAAIYFNRGSSEIMKELAKKIRAEGGRTTLIWSHNWKGPENLLMEAKAIVIEQGCAFAKEIRDTYLKFSANVEVHYVDHDGEFIDNADIKAIGAGKAANDLAEAFEETKAEIEDKALERAHATEPEGTDDEDIQQADTAVSESEESEDTGSETDSAVEGDRASESEDEEPVADEGYDPATDKGGALSD